ncbi:MAG: ABC transporter permease [Spirochaetales bacterium]|nr:ABC transporter permease [Spirochaetales bacterium]MCF7939244.1 ABC transporter permease [Spirochaetales bacterium]
MNNKKQIFINILKEQSQIIILIIFVVVFSIISPDFRTAGNFINLLKQVTVIGVISCGLTMVVITGCLDLSVGSVFSMLGLIAILCQQHSNLLGIAVPLAIAVAVGLFNGFIVTKYNVNSIIATLGSLSLFSGIALLITNGAIISGRTRTWYGIIGRGKMLEIPNHVFVLFLVAIIFHIILSRTSFGRKAKYVGTNRAAAQIAGIKTKKIRTIAFVISSLSVAIAVLIYTSRMTPASPIMGVGFEFDAVTAVVIGGTSLAGGKGSIFRTIIGVLLLATIINVLTLYNFPFAFQSIIKGMLIITAIVIDVRARKK